MFSKSLNILALAVLFVTVHQSQTQSTTTEGSTIAGGITTEGSTTAGGITTEESTTAGGITTEGTSTISAITTVDSTTAGGITIDGSSTAGGITTEGSTTVGGITTGATNTTDDTTIAGGITTGGPTTTTTTGAPSNICRTLSNCSVMDPPICGRLATNVCRRFKNVCDLQGLNCASPNNPLETWTIVNMRSCRGLAVGGTGLCVRRPRED